MEIIRRSDALIAEVGKRQRELQQVKDSREKGRIWESGIRLFVISKLLIWQVQFKGTLKGINTTEMGFNPSKIS